MRIYNGTKALVNLPLAGDQRITIGPESVSKDFMPSDAFLKLIVGAYGDDEIALIVSGPYEINMCAQIPALSTLTVETLDQALERFQVAKPKSEPVVEEKLPEAEKNDTVDEIVPEAEAKKEEVVEPEVSEVAATDNVDSEKKAESPVEKAKVSKKSRKANNK